MYNEVKYKRPITTYMDMLSSDSSSIRMPQISLIVLNIKSSPRKNPSLLGCQTFLYWQPFNLAHVEEF